MGSRVKELAGRLTLDEQHSLEELDHGPMRPKIPFDHATTLMDLGLTELCCGRLDLTAAGRHVLAEMRAA